jgi:hypothetical protein
MEGQIGQAITLVPLLAGLGLLIVCGMVIVKNPQISNSVALVLGVGALLCVAPTIAEFQGWGLKVTRKELMAQTEQSKSNTGEQGAKLKSELVELQGRIASIEKLKGIVAPPAPGPNKGTVVLIFYYERKAEALRIESFLLKSGYSANAVYTNFNELSPSRRRDKGETSVVYTPAARPLAEKIKKDLHEKFPLINDTADRQAEKLAAADVQILLF